MGFARRILIPCVGLCSVAWATSPFVILSGQGCELVNNSQCITSARRRRSSKNEHCDVRVHPDIGPLDVLEFDIDTPTAWVEVNGHKYSGGVGPQGVVPTFIHWTAQLDAEHKLGGWTICAGELPPLSPPVLLPSEQDRPFLLLDGTGCEVSGDNCLTSSRRRRYKSNEACVVQVADGVGGLTSYEMVKDTDGTLFVNNLKYDDQSHADGTLRPHGVIRWTSHGSVPFQAGWTVCVPPLNQAQELLSLRANQSDWVTDAWNGHNAAFTYHRNSTAGTVARLACESAFGKGACVEGSCGCFRYFYRKGGMTCNCGKKAGEYEWVFQNNGCVAVSQDYAGYGTEESGMVMKDAPPENVFVRRRAIGCGLGAWELALPSIQDGQKLPHLHLNWDLRASQFSAGSGTWSSISPLQTGAAAVVPGPSFDNEEQAFRFETRSGSDIITMETGDDFPVTTTWAVWAKVPVPEVKGSGVLMSSRSNFGDGTRAIPRKLDLTNVTLPANKWLHIVSAFGHEETLMFIDGQLTRTNLRQYDSPPSGAHNTLMVGGWDAPESARGTWAWISDVAVFNRSLSAQEIRDLFQAGRPSGSTTLTQRQSFRQCKYHGSFRDAAAALTGAPAPLDVQAPLFHVNDPYAACYVEGNCVATTRRRRATYDQRASCDIRVSEDAGPLTLYEFKTDPFDSFIITDTFGNSSSFSGWKGPDDFLSAATITWSTNSNNRVDRGWKLCAAEQPVDEHLHSARLYLDCLQYNNEDAELQLMQELMGLDAQSCCGLSQRTSCQSTVNGSLLLQELCPLSCNVTRSSPSEGAQGDEQDSPSSIWNLLSGSCEVSGPCATSPNYPLAVAANESCLLQGPLFSTSFMAWPGQTGNSTFSVDGLPYFDWSSSPPSALSANSVSWSSGNQPTLGWKVCSKVSTCGYNCAAYASVSCHPQMQNCSSSVVWQVPYSPSSLANRPYVEEDSCSNPKYVQLDFGSILSLGAVSLLSRPGDSHCGRAVELSKDGITWQVVFRQGLGYSSKETELGTTMEFMLQEARFARIYSGRSLTEPFARFLRVGAAGICEDDASWTDSSYGDGSMTCSALASRPAWCFRRGLYSKDAQQACPQTCGDCGKAFEPLEMNTTCLPEDVLDEAKSADPIVSALTCFWHCLTWEQCSHFEWEPGHSCTCFQGCQPIPLLEGRDSVQIFTIPKRSLPYPVQNYLDWDGFVFWQSHGRCAKDIPDSQTCQRAAAVMKAEVDQFVVEREPVVGIGYVDGNVCRYNADTKYLSMGINAQCDDVNRCLCEGKARDSRLLSEYSQRGWYGGPDATGFVSAEQPSFYFTVCTVANPKLCRGTTRTFRRIDVPISLGPMTYSVPVDWDGDGDMDILFGRGSGKLAYVESYGGAIDPASLQGIAKSTPGGSCFESWKILSEYIRDKYSWECSHWCCNIPLYGSVCVDSSNDWVACHEAEAAFGISAVGGVVPVPFDWDADGDYDLLIAGCDGNFQYWRRDGLKNLTRVSAQDTPFGNVILTEAHGCLFPEAVDWDGDGDEDLVVGSLSGRIYYFENMGASGFQLMEGARSPFSNVVVEDGWAVQSARDWDGDGDVDLLVGSRTGEVKLFERTEHGTLVAMGVLAMDVLPDNEARSNSIPRITDWNLDGKPDLLVANGDTGEIFVWVSDTVDRLTERVDSMNPFDGIPVGHEVSPQLIATGDRWDLLVGDHSGELGKFGRDDNGIFQLNTSNILGARIHDGLQGGMVHHATDWDGDGDVDLLVGLEGGLVLYHEYDSVTGHFLPGTQLFAGQLGTYPSPHAVDWDMDGDQDLLVGDSGDMGTERSLLLDGFPEPQWNVRFQEVGPEFMVNGREVFTTASREWVLAYCRTGDHWSLVSNATGTFGMIPGEECHGAVARRPSTPALLDRGFLGTPGLWEVRGTYIPQAAPGIPSGAAIELLRTIGSDTNPHCDSCTNRQYPECGCTLSHAMMLTCATEACNRHGFDSGVYQGFGSGLSERFAAVPSWQCDCQDLDERGQIKDAYGNACQKYTDNPGYCGHYDHLPGGFSSVERCCECGGGKRGNGTGHLWEVVAVCYNWGDVWITASDAVIADVLQQYGLEAKGSLRYYERTEPGVLVERRGDANPFQNVEIFPGSRPFPLVVDWNHDGRHDLVLGTDSPEVLTFTSDGSPSKPGCAWLDTRERKCTWTRHDEDVCAFALCRARGYQRGTLASHTPHLCVGTKGQAANGFVIDLETGSLATPQFWSLSILPTVVCEEAGIRFFERLVDGTMKERIGIQNPFSSIQTERFAFVQVVDFDLDGEWDVVVGDNSGRLRYFQLGEPCQRGQPCRGEGLCHPVLGTCTCVTGHSLSDCSRCLDGYYSVRTGLAAIGDCLPCPGLGSQGGLCAGRGTCYDDSTARQDAVSRADGSNSSISLAFGSGDCLCSPHFTGEDSLGLSSCASGSCPPGFELRNQEGTSVSACSPCQRGYSKSLAGNHPCELCPSGRYSEAARSPTCEACPAGKYQERAGQDSCQPCLRTTFSSSGSSSCTGCPVGRYADTAEMSECSRCEPGKWSSVEGAEECQQCDVGRFGTGLESCQQCASGSYAEVPGTSACVLCGRGRYSSAQEATSSSTCQPCGVGRFSDSLGVEAKDLCMACPLGATTAAQGAVGSSSCIQPAKGNFSCVSGRSCFLNITGKELQPKHQLALSRPPSTGRPAVLVPDSISKPSIDGSTYEWLEPIVLAGGAYDLLWCPGIREPCADLPDFGFRIGFLNVEGPVPSSFLCVRGQSCEDLGPVSGLGLHSTDAIQVQESCGLGPAVALSNANDASLGMTADVSPTAMTFGFGPDAVVVNPDDSYQVCWCATKQAGDGLASCNAVGDFLVPVGTLRIEGPQTGHEVTCWLGQHCRMSGIEGVGLASGDQLMVLETCGVPDQYIEGVPGGGVAEMAAGVVDFEFLPLTPPGAQKVLRSFPGLYRVCFCRKSVGQQGTSCATSADFIADTGFFAARGPYGDQDYGCFVSADCNVFDLQGLGLEDGDALEVQPGTSSTCSGNSSTAQHLAGLPAAFVASRNGGKDYALGVLPSSAAPGTYSLCWRPGSHSLGAFGARVGSLFIACPAGTYRLATQHAALCEECPLGFFCRGASKAGGFRDDAKTKCGAGKSTQGKGSAAAEDCLCDAGFFMESGGECVECPEGRYKPLVANNATCPEVCPNGTLSAAGASSDEHCYRPFIAGTGSNVSQAAAVYVVEGILRLPACLPEEQMREATWQLRQTLADSLRVSRTDIELIFPEGSEQGCPSQTRSSPTARILQDQQPTQLVIYKVSQASEAEARKVLQSMNFALIQAEMLSSVGILVTGEEPPSLSSKQLDCSTLGPGMSFPLGGRPTSLDECTCIAGHERDPLTKLCAPCAIGLFKDSIGEQPCSLCKVAAIRGAGLGSVRMTTLFTATVEEHLCVCPAGYFQNDSLDSAPTECSQCGIGHICPGGSARAPCPVGTTTSSETAGGYTGCVCDAGFSPLVDRNETHRCLHCEPGFFKSVVGDAPCSQACPSNRHSKAGAVASSDCFCNFGFYYESHTDSCQPCPPDGVHCPGGFDPVGSKLHAKPTSIQGYYMTGYAVAEECNIFDEEETESLCLEGVTAFNTSQACAGHQTGIMCGACQHLSARDLGDEPCEPCEDEFPDIAHLAFLNLDLLLKAAFGIFLGKEAIDTSAEATKLDAVILRIVLQWMTACSVLASFDLSSTDVFDWSTVEGTEGRVPVDSVTAVMTASGLSFKFQFPEWFRNVWRSMTALAASIPSPQSPQASLECLIQKQRTDGLQTPSRSQLLLPAVWWLLYPATVTFWVVVLCLLIAKVAYPITKRATRKLTERLTAIGVQRASALAALRDPAIAQRVFKEPLVLKNSYKVVEIVGGEVYAEAAAFFLLQELGAECRTMLQGLLDEERISDSQVLNEVQGVLAGDPTNLEAFLRNVFRKIDRGQVTELFTDPRSTLPVLEEFLASETSSSRSFGRYLSRRTGRSSATDSVRCSERKGDSRSSEKSAKASLRRSLNSLFEKPAEDKDRDEEEAHDKYVVFGLFRDTSCASVLMDAFPLYAVTMYSIWDTVTTRMLGLIQGKTILIAKSQSADGKDIMSLESRWLYDMRFALFKGDHIPVALVGILGLAVWSVGFLVVLFRTLNRNKHHLQDRQMVRQFGYFYNGLEPNSYWWEVLVKKGDVLLIYVVTYTEIFHDPRAKLIMYMGLAGVFWAAHNMHHPYSKTQNKLADRIEDMGLSTRFATVMILQILLMLNAGKQVNAAMAMIIIAANMRFICTIAFVLCVEMPDIEDSEAKGTELSKNAFGAMAEGGSNPLTKAIAWLLNFLFGYIIKPFVALFIKVMMKIAKMKAMSTRKVPHLQWQGVGMDLVVVSHAENAQLPWYERIFAFFFTYLYKLTDHQQKSFLAHSMGQFWDHVLNNSGCHQLPSCITDIFFLLPFALKKESEEEFPDHDIPFHIRVAKRIRKALSEAPRTASKRMRLKSTAGTGLIHSANTVVIDSRLTMSRKTSFHHSTGVPEHTHSGEEFNAALLFIQRLTKSEVHAFIDNAEPEFFEEQCRRGTATEAENGHIGVQYSI